MNNTIWCGNFVITTKDKNMISYLEEATELLNKINNECDKNNNLIKDLAVSLDNKNLGDMDLHTFLFFNHPQKYYLTFKSFEKVDIQFFLEDFFYKDSYLQCDNIDESFKGAFFSELMNYFNNNFFLDTVLNKYKNFTKEFLLSFTIKEMFKYSKNKFIIPQEYQIDFLKNLSDKKIFQYNYNTFKKVFKSIDSEIKQNYFNENSVLEFFSPMLELGYAYKFLGGQLIHTTTKLIKPTRNDFEVFFFANKLLFEKLNENEQLNFFKIIVHHGRKELFEYVFHNYASITREKYSQTEYEDLLKKCNKSNMNIDLDKYFLFKKINNKLDSKPKEKRLKI